MTTCPQCGSDRLVMSSERNARHCPDCHVWWDNRSLVDAPVTPHIFKPRPREGLTDAEMRCLCTVLDAELAGMGAENEARANRGAALAYGADAYEGLETAKALRAELTRRGVLGGDGE